MLQKFKVIDNRWYEEIPPNTSNDFLRFGYSLSDEILTDDFHDIQWLIENL